MKKIIFVACGVLLVMGTSVWAAEEGVDEQVQNRVESRGDRANERLDRKGDRI